jgi:hypothetical protein
MSAYLRTSFVTGGITEVGRTDSERCLLKYESKTEAEPANLSLFFDASGLNLLGEVDFGIEQDRRAPPGVRVEPCKDCKSVRARV